MRHTPDPVRRPRLRPLTAAVAAVLGGSLAADAIAQNGTMPGRRALEEVTVTASRRTTTVQELPFNITAVSGDVLEQQRLTTLSEFSRWVPGLTVVDQGARGADLMTVRGLTVRSLDGSEFLDNGSGGTVATYFGEVPMYMDFKMHDIERIEVLLGPQGTLYGSGTLGGAIRYIPVEPDTAAASFDMTADVFGVAESDDLGYQTDFVVNLPIVSDRLAFRGAFSYFDHPGFIDYPYVLREPGVSDPEPDLSDPAAVAQNLYRIDDANTEQTFSSRLSLLWEVSSGVRATFNYYYQEQDAGARTVNHRHAFGTGRYESAHRFPEPNRRENELFSVEVVADLGFAELTSASAVSAYDELGQRDQTDLLLDFEYGYETFPSFAAFTREDAAEDRYNQELRLVSTGDSRLNWIVGAFFNQYEVDAVSEEFAPGFPEFIGETFPEGDLEFRLTTREKLVERALYGEIGYRFTDRLSATIGGRAFEYENAGAIGSEIPFFAIESSQANAVDDDGFLGKINAAYEFSDDVTGYVTLSEGYRLGGINGQPECEVPLPPGQNACALPDEILIKPDRTTNFEIGMHSLLADGRLQFNAALFRIDWEDIQTQGTTENGALRITVNGGEARSQGLEIGFAAATDGPFDFRGSYAYTDAQLTSFAAGLVDGADAFAGDRLSGTPEHQASFHAGWSRSLNSGWALEAGYGFTVTSDVLTKVGQRNNGEVLGGYTIHNASIGLAKDRFSARLYADNLTNKFAETAVRLDPSYIRDVNGFALRRYFRNVLPPRTVGIQFRYQLGD